MATPCPPFGTAAAPAASVPMRLPWMVRVRLPDRREGESPNPDCPEMTLPGGAPAWAVGPPITPE